MIHLFDSDPLDRLLDRPVVDSSAFGLAAFAHDLHNLGPVAPGPALAGSHLERMRAAAGDVMTMPLDVPAEAAARRKRIAGRAALGAVSIPLVASGLAVAGVDLPDPASDAFERVGIELPNQSGNAESDQRPLAPPDSLRAQPSGPETTTPADEAGGGGQSPNGSPPPHAGSKGKPDHAGKPDQPGTAPPHANGQGNPHSPPSGPADGVGPPGTPPPSSNGANGTGPAAVPPGHGGEPPGQSDTPPGQSNGPPAIPPGQDQTTGPPPHSNPGGNPDSAAGGGSPATPPGQSKR